MATRNPGLIHSPVEVDGSLSIIIYVRFIQIFGGCLGFLNQQQNELELEIFCHLFSLVIGRLSVWRIRPLFFGGG